jgi:hypothetical protein
MAADWRRTCCCHPSASVGQHCTGAGASHAAAHVASKAGYELSLLDKLAALSFRGACASQGYMCSLWYGIPEGMHMVGRHLCCTQA